MTQRDIGSILEVVLEKNGDNCLQRKKKNDVLRIAQEKRSLLKAIENHRRMIFRLNFLNRRQIVRKCDRGNLGEVI